MLSRVSFARAEKLVLPFSWKFSLWTSGCQQQKSSRKLMCRQHSHFFQGRRIFANLSAMNCAYYLPSREFVFWSLLHSAEYIWHWCSKAVSGAHWHLFQHFLLCWAWILYQFSQLQTSQRSTKAFAVSDVRGGPSWCESWHSSVPSPPASGKRSNQPNLFLLMLFTVPNSSQGRFFFLLMSRIYPPERNSQQQPALLMWCNSNIAPVQTHVLLWSLNTGLAKQFHPFLMKPESERCFHSLEFKNLYISRT